jgi:hypothetical protein
MLHILELFKQAVVVQIKYSLIDILFSDSCDLHK